MITISHTQARRLIQAQLDGRPLPESQWAALHAHLEGCLDCRAQRDRLAAAERGLRRTLRQRWEAVDGPAHDDAPALAGLHLAGRQIRRNSGWLLGAAALFLVGVLVYVGFAFAARGADRAAAQDANTTAPQTPTPQPTATRARPTAEGARGVIAYERHGEGEGVHTAGGDPAAPGEIYLLNLGAEPVNLTNHPAHDRAPAWSPDGEWLAFLSDRAADGAAGGKEEVHVMHISGTRLTRLTNLPEVGWQPPISWSPDGQMLALLGERPAVGNSETWVFLVPLDGSNGYPLGYSAGAVQAAFSPAPGRRWLAFISRKYWGGKLMIYGEPPAVNTLPGQIAPAFRQVDFTPTGRGQPARSSQVEQFAWSPDGASLLFRQANHGVDAGSGAEVTRRELRVVQVDRESQSGNLVSRAYLSSHPRMAYPEFTWTGSPDEAAYLVDGDVEGCLEVQVGSIQARNVRLPRVEGLCVERSLQATAWRGGESSLLVVGRDPQDGEMSQPGLYQLVVAGNQAQLRWLADAAQITSAPVPRPEVARALAVAPRPVPPPGPPRDPPPLPGAETGDLLLTWTLNERTLIDRAAAGGSRRVTIQQSVGENRCPTWSPDRAQIAFLSDRNSQRPEANEIFVMNAAGQGARQLSPALAISSTYGCPVWSPDGRWLASKIMAGSGDQVVVLPLEADEVPRTLPNLPGTSLSALDWLPDGRLLVAPNGDHTSLLLLAYQLEELTQGVQSNFPEIIRSDGGLYLSALAVAPDGVRLAMLVVDSSNGRDAFRLRVGALRPVADPPDIWEDRLEITYWHNLEASQLGLSSLHWLPDGRLAYLLHNPAGERAKAELFVVQPEAWQRPERAAAFEDVVLATAWSQDGTWLAVTTEIGRYVLRVAPGAESIPARVGDETSTWLDW